MLRQDPTYSIVIPTRERHDTLRHSLSTALNQTCADYEIIVMDNASSGATRDVVQTFGGDRVRYFRAPNVLPMSDNWELALQYVKGKYVFYLGDDDGLLPDAVEIATKLHGWFPDRVIGWKPVTWVWPDSFIEEFRSVLHMHISSRVETRHSREVLRRFYAYDSGAHDLPSAYNGFVPMAVVRQVQQSAGKYFLLRSPDICSGIANLVFSDWHVYSYRPLSVWGASKYSTGMSFSFKHVRGADVNVQELKSTGIDQHPLDPSLDGEQISEVLIADDLVKAKALLLMDDPSVQLNMRGLIRSMVEAAPRYADPSDFAELVRAIASIADRSSLPSGSYPAPVQGKGPQRLVRNYRLDTHANMATFDFYTDARVYPTIAELVGLVASMSMGSESLDVQQADALALG